MTLIDGDKSVTAQLYDDEHEEFTEKEMSIIDFVNAYTDEGVTTADDVLDKIRAEIVENSIEDYKYHGCGTDELIIETSEVLNILDKYKAESEENYE